MTRLNSAFLKAPIAHRGFHSLRDGVPENSRAAFLAAVEHGYGIELDLQMSSDGVAMVFHDYDLARLTGTSGAIRQKTAAELQALTLIGNGEPIPTLIDVLELVAGRTPLLIELKDQDGAMGPNTGALAQTVAANLTGYDGPVALMSFNPHAVADLAKHAPDIPRGIITESWQGEDVKLISAARRAELARIEDYGRVGACFISHQAADLGNPRVAELKAGGAHVLCWTIRSPEAEAKARKVAENITFEGYAARHPAP